MRYRSILFEDDKPTREFLTSLLQQRNHDVFSYSAPRLCPLYSSPDCRCPKEQVCGDFLITDNQMPGMTGLEFIQRQAEGKCRAAAHNKALLSGQWSPEEWDLGIRLGCKLFRKPLDLDEFSAWLTERENLVSPKRKLSRID